jgi:hypothetical protein
VTEDSVLLGNDVSLGNQIPTFQGNVVPSSSRVKQVLMALHTLATLGYNCPLMQGNITEE